MDNYSRFNHLQELKEWDVEDLVDTLHITTEELLSVEEFRERAYHWIEDNYE